MRISKIQVLFVVLMLCFSCAEQKKNKPITTIEREQEHQINHPEFQGILDAAKVKGSIVIYDAQKRIFHSNDFAWAEKPRLPASTFKIPNTIIALETGVVESDSTLLEWDGEPRMLKIWEQDLFFSDAFQLSCVPCYQEIARAVGAKRMNSYIEKFKYGAMQIDATNIDLFWLEGESAISQFEQIDFLQRLYQSELPISKRTEQQMKKMMHIDSTIQYALSGKTGLAHRGESYNGWFVGYVITNKGVYFFATNIEPLSATSMRDFQKSRKDVTLSAFAQLKFFLD